MTLASGCSLGTPLRPDATDPADRVADRLWITSQHFVQSSAPQSIEIPERNQGPRLDAVAQTQPHKITERLFSRREHLVRRFGINAGGHADEPQFACRRDAIRPPVVATAGKAGDLRWHLGNDVAAKQRVKALDVSTRINFRHDVFGSHSLGWAIIISNMDCLKKCI